MLFSLSNSQTLHNINKNVELAVFVERSARHNLLSSTLVKNDAELFELCLSFVSQIREIYRYANIAISLVKLEFLDEDILFDSTNQILNSNQLNDETDSSIDIVNRDRLLDTFCEFQASKRQSSHWDVAMLLSGRNFYTDYSNVTDFSPLGLSPIGGACSEKQSCVIVEFGRRMKQDLSSNKKVDPNFGLMSVWTAIHELGHK